MIIDDLENPTLGYRLGWGTLAALLLVAMSVAGWQMVENHRLNATNAHLVWMLDERLDLVAAARTTAFHRDLDERLWEALTGGARPVAELLLARLADK